MGRARLGKRGSGDGEFTNSTALALVPGLGLVVRDDCGMRLQFFATPDAIAMTSMSEYRVGWLVAVARAVRHRALCKPVVAIVHGAAAKRQRGWKLDI